MEQFKHEGLEIKSDPHRFLFERTKNQILKTINSLREKFPFLEKIERQGMSTIKILIVLCALGVPYDKASAENDKEHWNNSRIDVGEIVNGGSEEAESLYFRLSKEMDQCFAKREQLKPSQLSISQEEYNGKFYDKSTGPGLDLEALSLLKNIRISSSHIILEFEEAGSRSELWGRTKMRQEISNEYENMEIIPDGEIFSHTGLGATPRDAVLATVSEGARAVMARVNQSRVHLREETSLGDKVKDAQLTTLDSQVYVESVKVVSIKEIEIQGQKMYQAVVEIQPGKYVGQSQEETSTQEN